jgi:hypothetical protein
VELLRGGDDGLVIAPGKSSESPLINRVSGVDPEKVMPPKGDRLTIEQIDLLRKWIDLGVPWPEIAKTDKVQPTVSDHWAFQTAKLPPIPAVKNRGWARNPIDHFVLAQLEEKGLAAAPEADRRTLVRRLSFDLLGLPPAPEVVETFINDQRSDAYEHLVDGCWLRRTTANAGRDIGSTSRASASHALGRQTARPRLALSRLCDPKL